MTELSIMLKEENNSFRINRYVLKESFGRVEVWEKSFKVNKKIGEFDVVRYGNVYITMASHNTLTLVSFHLRKDKEEDIEDIEIFKIENKYPCEVGCKVYAELEPLSFIQCGDKTLVPTQIDNRIRIFNYHTFIDVCKYVKFSDMYIGFFYYFDEEEDSWKLMFYMDNINHLGEKDVYVTE